MAGVRPTAVRPNPDVFAEAEASRGRNRAPGSDSE